MADLSDIQAAGSTKIIGSDATGLETTPINGTTAGGLHVNLRNNAGTEIGTTANPAIVAGPGVAGTPAGGVLSIQGVAGGTAVPSSQSGAWTVAATQSGTWTVGLSEDHNFGTVGAATLRVAAQVGNATGAALFGAGTTTAQVLRVVLPTDQSAIPVTQSGTWTVTAAEDKNYGTVGATTLRVAAQVGNATGAADYNAGATGAQTLRVVANQGAPNTAANGWFARLTDGTNNVAVKAASTAAVAADPALVVALSPNTPLPAGTAVIGALSANQSVNLSQVGGSAISLGQKTMANSIPVVLPSDQTLTVTSSPLPATGSGFAFGDIATSATTQVSVRRTAYTEQTANAQRSIASSSANDTSAGTGARQVTITYYTATFTGPFTETVTLNGTAFVNTINTNICYIEKMVVASVGSGGVNAGILTLKAATAGGGATIGTVATGDNETFWTHHYVPTGKTCYISGFSISSTAIDIGTGALFVLKSKSLSAATNPENQVSDFHTLYGASSGTTNRPYNSPIQVAGPARITAYVTPLAATAVTQRASFDYIDN